MDKPEKRQILVISPENELKFTADPDKTKEYPDYSAEIKLLNPTDKKVLFKIKTTAPKKYCVRPNSGTVDSKGTVSVKIWVNSESFDPSEKNKHKFMVQSLVAPEGDVDVEQLWKEVKPDQLMDTKLRCVFKLPEEKSPKPANISQATTNISESAKLIKEETVIQPSSQVGTNGEHNPEELYTFLKSLREEESQLRRENLQLKEEVLRSKESAPISSVPQFPNNPYTPIVYENSQQTLFIFIAIAIGMAVFGLILGKFVL